MGAYKGSFDSRNSAEKSARASIETHSTARQKAACSSVQARSAISLVLSCPVLRGPVWSGLSCLVLSGQVWSVLSRPILSCLIRPVLPCPAWSGLVRSVLSCPVLSCLVRSVLSGPLLSGLVWSCLVWFGPVGRSHSGACLVVLSCPVLVWACLVWLGLLFYSCWSGLVCCFILAPPSPPCRLLHEAAPGLWRSQPMERPREEVSSAGPSIIYGCRPRSQSSERKKPLSLLCPIWGTRAELRIL